MSVNIGQYRADMAQGIEVAAVTKSLTSHPKADCHKSTLPSSEILGLALGKPFLRVPCQREFHLDSANKRGDTRRGFFLFSFSGLRVSPALGP